MAAGRRALLDDDEDGEEAAPPQLRVNEAYAKRFTYNKERQDLRRLEELKERGLVTDSEDESTSEDEDEDGILPSKTEVRILDTLAKIKSRDPSIYKSNATFFEAEDDEDDHEAEQTRVKKEKPQYLKDVIARQLLESGPDVHEEEAKLPKAKNYFTEQEELKRAFLEGVRQAEGDEDGDNLLKVKKKSAEEVERDKKESEEAIAWVEQKKRDKEISQKLEEYFGRDDGLDDNEKFLKGYLLNKGWIDNEQRGGRFDDEAELLSEDEDALDQQDEYEADYNFRFEQGDNAYVKGHSRFMEDSVRKKQDHRIKQREAKKLRQLEEERIRQEELKRLKNLKKKEIREKLSRIRTVAGIESGVDEDDLEEEFDPEEYDKKMKDAFGEEYYGAEDPDFDSDGDELDVALDDESENWKTGDGGGAGFLAVKSKLATKSKVNFEEKAMIDKHLEEYYKLDYEDVIGDMPTRFKYTQVKPNSYRLRTDDILGLDDQELNQYVSLKKLAPYRSHNWVAKGKPPRVNKKLRRKLALSTDVSSVRKRKPSDVYPNGLNVANVDLDGIEAEKAGTESSKTRKTSTVSESLGDGIESRVKLRLGEPGGTPENKEGKTKRPKRKKRKPSAPLPESRMETYLGVSKKIKKKR